MIPPIAATTYSHTLSMADNPENVRIPLEKKTLQRPQSELNIQAFGKVQPQAVDLEEAVLGAMLLDKDAVTNVVDILKPDSFYLESHRAIYQAMMRLFEKSKPVDLLTVTEELKLMGELDTAGGAYYVTELTNRVASSAHVETHARIIAEKYILRELIKVSTDIIKNSYDETTDVFDLLDKAEQNLFNITEQNLKTSSESMSALLSKAITEIEELRKREDSLTGIPTGFTALDRITAGWQKSDLIILAARPGMGKTSFVLSLARNAAVNYNQPIAVFSLEMSKLQLVNRLIASETELESEKLRKGSLKPYEWTQLTTKVAALAEAPIFIDDTAGINIFELRAKCRRLKMQHDIQLVIIDYLQLMSGTGDGKNSNREQEISNISRSLKGIAKELNIPVIALSQLNRAVETRGGDKRPQLSDLRESGAIEQDADLVSFIYRPEYYNIMQDANGQSTEGIAEIIIAKHRNGALDTVPLRFISRFTKFVNLDFGEEVPQGFKAISDESGTIVRGSRMNDPDADREEDTTGDVPF